MERIDVTKACAGYNAARNANAGRKMGREQIISILKENGISESLALRMSKSDTLFTRYQRENCGKGRHLGYIWPQMPIHVSIFKNWLYPTEEKKPVEKKKNLSFEEECAEYLRKQGYKLKKCIGFDEDSFKKDYPQLWSKYLIYEEV